MKAELQEIEISTETAALGVVLGLAAPVGDGAYELTPAGRDWLDEWMSRRVKSLLHREALMETS